MVLVVPAAKFSPRRNRTEGIRDTAKFKDGEVAIDAPKGLSPQRHREASRKSGEQPG
jgi:hypothetical protein